MILSNFIKNFSQNTKFWSVRPKELLIAYSKLVPKSIHQIAWFQLQMGVSCESEAKKCSCEFFRKSLFELKFLPAGMYTPWSISVSNCHPIVQNLFTQWIVEVDIILFKVTNESTQPSFNYATLLVIVLCFFKNKI